MKRILAVIFVTFFGLVTMAHAKDNHWATINTTGAGKLDIDLNNIGSPAPGVKDIWLRTTNYEPIDVNGKAVAYGLVRQLVNCQNKTRVETFLAMYDGRNNQISSQLLHEQWAPIIPGSVFDAVADAICSQ